MDRNKSRTYKAQANEMRNRLGERDYVLGLDLGVGSIGIATIALEKIDGEGPFATDLVYAGSRVFKASDGAADRRMQRGSRNCHRHKANRLKYLWNILAEKGLMLPFSDEDVSNPTELRFSEEIRKKDPYELRLKGLSSPLNLQELGYAIYHIANHRGPSSVRSFCEEENCSVEEKKKKEAEVKSLKVVATTKNLAVIYGVDTFIEVITRYSQENGKKYRNNSLDSDKCVPIPTRDIIKNEIIKLLNNQKIYYPNILNDEYINRIISAVLYENPKLVPEPGSCPYFPNEKKLPKASFINEERRLWEALNNVRIEYGWILNDNSIRRTSKIALSIGEKRKLFNYLREGNDLNEKKIKKILCNYQDCRRIVLQGVDKKTMKIKGFRFRDLEKWEPFKRLSFDEKEDFIRKYVNIPDDESFKQYLINELGFSKDESEEALSNVSLVGDYAPVGPSAMKIILPLIIDEGLSFQEAEQEAIKRKLLSPILEKKVYDFLPYYGEVIPASTQHLMGKAWHSEFRGKWDSEGFIKPYTSKEEEKYGRIANPVVHQTLNELRKLINELISILGKKPSQVTIELGREIKMGAEKREEYSKELTKKEKINERIFNEYCVPNNKERKYVKHFRLLVQQGFLCPYCNKPISVNDIVTGNADLDHIFPKEDTFDSSENNLVVAHKVDCNAIKGKRIPHTAFSSDLNRWSEIMQYLENNKELEGKKWRFEMNEEEYRIYLERNSFLNRFSSDNSYVARVACEYLHSLFSEEEKYTSVNTIKGAETAMLRNAWNLNGITNELSRSIKCMKKQEKKETSKSKQRDDVRHHALDAIVAAYYTPSIKHLINNLTKKYGVYEVGKRLPIPRYFRHDSPLSTLEQRNLFRDVVSDFIFNHTFVSRKVDYGKNGSLVDDTQQAIVASSDTDLVMCTKKRITTLFESKQKINKLYGNKSDSLEGVLTNFIIQKWVPEKKKIVIENMLENNKNLFDKICSKYDESKHELELKNEKDKQQGKKEKVITETNIIMLACNKIGGKYYQLSNFKRQKVYVAKEPTVNEKGYGYKTGDNYCLDFYHNEEGKLKCEVIRLFQAVTKGYIPDYVKKGFKLIERLYRGDVLEVDFEDSICLENSTNSENTNSSSRRNINSLKAPNSLNGRTFVTVNTFTEVGEKIQIHMDSILSSQIEASGSKCNTTMQKWNVRKIKLSEAGLVVYRSKIIKDNKDVENS